MERKESNIDLAKLIAHGMILAYRMQYTYLRIGFPTASAGIL